MKPLLLTRAEVEAIASSSETPDATRNLALDWLTMEAERPKPRTPGEWRPEDPVWPPPERN